MTYYRYVVVVIMALLVSACGRQLPDPSIENQVDSEIAESIDVPEVSGDDAASDDTADNNVVEAVAQRITLERLVEDVSGFGSPDNQRVAAVLDANPIEGQALFNQSNLPGGAQACSSCHTVTDARLVGPGMLGMPQRATTTVSGQSAAVYIYNSIVSPNEHIVESYPQGVMPQNYGDVLSSEQLANLTAYLLTLNEGGALPIEELAEELLSGEAEAEATPETVAQAPTQTPWIITATPQGAAEEAIDEAPAEATEAATDEAEVTEEPARVVTVQVIVTATPLPTDEAPAEETEVAMAPTLPPTPSITATPDQVARLASLGIPAYGEDTFQQSCAECHSVDSAEMGDDGPGLLGIPQRAAQQAEGQSAAGYLYDSLTDTAVHETNYADELGRAQVYDLVAYMLTLDADDDSAAAPAETTADSTAEATEAPQAGAASAEASLSPLQEAIQNADPVHGEELFAMIEGGSPCSTCHYVDSTDSLVGPGMLGLAERAAERVDDQSAEEYLYNSIIHPNEYVVDGYPGQVMPLNYEDLLSEQDLYDLVAYMLTLTDE